MKLRHRFYIVRRSFSWMSLRSALTQFPKIAVREFIKTINRENKTTVILTTHDMQDIEALTERILLIGKGRILLDGSLSELKTRNSTHKTLIGRLYRVEKLPVSEHMTVVKESRRAC